jgi:predicted transcriptional regulator
LRKTLECRKICIVPAATPQDLPRREKQALEVLYRLGEATAAQVMDELEDLPSYSAARAIMSLLVAKGLARVKPNAGSRQYVYQPATPAQKARKSALRQVVDTFFEKSPFRLAANLLDPSSQKLNAEEIAALRELLDQQEAVVKGRPKP